VNAFVDTRRAAFIDPSHPWEISARCYAASGTHALVSLHSAGLIHRLEEFVFPTRAAVRFWELGECWFALLGEDELAGRLSLVHAGKSPGRG
jgi:hypothetical protein